MKDLRQKQTTTNKKTKGLNIFKAILTLIWSYRSIAFIIFGIFITYNIIFNPASVAGIIANWINDFIGTLVNTVNI